MSYDETEMIAQRGNLHFNRGDAETNRRQENSLAQDFEEMVFLHGTIPLENISRLEEKNLSYYIPIHGSVGMVV